MSATNKNALAEKLRATAILIESTKGRKSLIVSSLIDRNESLSAIEGYLRNKRNEQLSVRYAVRSARSVVKSSGTDKLEHRANRFSRSGSYAESMMRELDRKVEADKRPDAIAAGNAVSVEIECFLPARLTCCPDRDWNGDFCASCGSDQVEYTNPRQKLIRAIRNAKLSASVTVKSDGSLRPGDNEYPVEVVVTFSRDNRKPLYAVGEILRSMGATVNKSCGLHVHLDMRHVTGRGAMARARKIASAVPYLKRILPPSRRDNSFCRYDLSGIRDGHRYSFVNGQAYRKHKTIEVRGHSGTTDAVKIDQWINLMIALADKRKKTAPIRTYEELTAFLGSSLSDDLASWIRERESRFNRVSEERAAREMEAHDNADPDSDEEPPRVEHPDDVEADNEVEAPIFSTPVYGPISEASISAEPDWAAFHARLEEQLAIAQNRASESIPF